MNIYLNKGANDAKNARAKNMIVNCIVRVAITPLPPFALNIVP